MEKAIDPTLIKFKYQLSKMNFKKIKFWKDRIESGASINNILVLQEKGKYSLLEGKNRLIAYLICRTPTILADIIEKPRDNSFLDDNDNL